MPPFTICTVFVCTHAVGGGRDKGLSFLTHCLVTLSGYDRACTCSSSFSSLVFPLPIFPSENDRNCTLRRGRGGRDRENGGGGMGEMWGSHMFTQNTAKGYQPPISINSSGLASLDASGGWGQCYPCVGSQLAVCRAKTEAYNIKKKRTVWISSWLDKRMRWEHPDASNRGDIAACASVAARMHRTLSRSALGAASPVIHHSLCCLSHFAGVRIRVAATGSQMRAESGRCTSHLSCWPWWMTVLLSLP